MSLIKISVPRNLILIVYYINIQHMSPVLCMQHGMLRLICNQKL